jgi:hypothetical protein
LRAERIGEQTHVTLPTQDVDRGNDERLADLVGPDRGARETQPQQLHGVTLGIGRET